MSWLSQIEKMYFFRCSHCEHDFHIVDLNFNLDDIKAKCPICGSSDIEYKGFQNIDEINFSSKVKRKTYDQNGRKAVKIGNTYMSQTKYNYLETGKIQNVYTPQYESQLKKDEQKNEYLLKTEENKRRAFVSELRDSANKKSNSKTV